MNRTIATPAEQIRQLEKGKKKLTNLSYRLYLDGGFSDDYRFMQHIQMAVAGMLREIALLRGQQHLPIDEGYENGDDTPF
jgi:hypothetical protein